MMIPFEYQVVPLPNPGPTRGFDENAAGTLLQKCLNDHAAKGWRFVVTIQDNIVFEKPLIKTPDVEEEEDSTD